MPTNSERKYRQIIDYVEDQIGADIDRDLMRMAISAQDISALDMSTALDGTIASAGSEELRTRLLGEDSGGSLREVDAEQLDTGVSGTAVAQLTYLARALNSQDLDEFITRVTDSTGTQIDPLNQDALETVANDELRSRLHDSTGTQIDPLTQAVVESVASDWLRASLYADDPGGALTRLNVNSSGELETSASLSGQSMYLDGDDDDGNTLNPNAETLSQAITDPDGLITYIARALETQRKDAIRTRETSKAESMYKHDDGTILPGDSWIVPTGEVWRAGQVTADGVLNLEGEIKATDGVDGTGTITGEGTITLTDYTQT